MSYLAAVLFIITSGLIEASNTLPYTFYYEDTKNLNFAVLHDNRKLGLAVFSFICYFTA